MDHTHDSLWANVAKYVDLSNNPQPKKSAPPKRKVRVNAFEDEDTPAAKAQKQQQQKEEEAPQQPKVELKDTSRMRKILIQLKNN